MGQTQEHSSQQKAKARKSGPKALDKAIALGAMANVTSIMTYWDPTHRRFRVAFYIPEGKAVPDVNSLVRITTVTKGLD